ncbi:hypothetical protein HZ326_20248 [Fusarium oxysporum f. sp. albedinis]|nr:hypothetical protein HZ326_20248 [Fusarium oxysporum f. sp. albedinis]
MSSLIPLFVCPTHHVFCSLSATRTRNKKKPASVELAQTSVEQALVETRPSQAMFSRTTTVERPRELYLPCDDKHSVGHRLHIEPSQKHLHLGRVENATDAFFSPNSTIYQLVTRYSHCQLTIKPVEVRAEYTVVDAMKTVAVIHVMNQDATKRSAPLTSHLLPTTTPQAIDSSIPES